MFDPAPMDGVVFHAASDLDATAVAQVQQCLRRQLLRRFERRGLLPAADAQAIAAWEHGDGFSVDASVRIAGADRGGRERLLRHCARSPFALDRLRELDPERLLYERTKPGPDGSGPLRLTPLELLDRLAALIPPPRAHRHRYYGALAPNAPLRAAVTALALVAVPTSFRFLDLLRPLRVHRHVSNGSFSDGRRSARRRQSNVCGRRSPSDCLQPSDWRRLSFRAG